MNIKLFLTLILTISGCSYQIIDISNRYFSYKTTQFLSLRINGDMYVPAVSVCWLLDQVIKQFVYMTKKGIDRKTILREMYGKMNTLTIAEIFNLTPATNETLVSNPACAVRLPKELSWRNPWYNKTECQDLFTIDRYVHRLSLCYRFTPRENIKRIDAAYNTLSPSNPGFIYMLFLNPKIFNHVTSFTAYGHSRNSSQLFDSYFSIEKKIHGHPFRIGIMSTPITVHDLPAPYDSKCRIVPGYGSGLEYALDRLNNQSMDKMKYSHTLGHVHKPLLYPILTPGEFRKEGIITRFNSLFEQARRYEFRQCDFKYNIPKTRLEEDERITIAVNWSQDIELTRTTIPDQIIIDFIIYVCSSIGIWLGLSIFSVMRMAIDVSRKKKPIEDNHHNACVREIRKRNIRVYSRFRDMHLITSGHSQALCNLIRVINYQKNSIQNLAIEIRMIKEKI